MLCSVLIPKDTCENKIGAASRTVIHSGILPRIQKRVRRSYSIIARALQGPACDGGAGERYWASSWKHLAFIPDTGRVARIGEVPPA